MIEIKSAEDIQIFLTLDTKCCVVCMSRDQKHSRS